MLTRPTSGLGLGAVELIDNRQYKTHSDGLPMRKIIGSGQVKRHVTVGGVSFWKHQNLPVLVLPNDARK
jgi:hypothetical protein